MYSGFSWWLNSLLTGLWMFVQTVSHLTGVPTVSGSIYPVPFSCVSDQWYLCLRGITKTCACFGVWLNSFMLCKLDKCFYDCIGSWITLFTLHEGIWQLSVWFRMRFWVLIFYHISSQIFFSVWSCDKFCYFSVMEVHIHIYREAAHLPCHANAKFYILTPIYVEDPLLPQACSLNNLSRAHEVQWQILSTTWLKQSYAWSVLVGTQKYFMVELLFHTKKILLHGPLLFFPPVFLLFFCSFYYPLLKPFFWSRFFLCSVPCLQIKEL